MPWKKDSCARAASSTLPPFDGPREPVVAAILQTVEGLPPESNGRGEIAGEAQTRVPIMD
jgi:hypothetical protein